MTPAYEGWTCQAQVSSSGSAVPTALQGDAPLGPLPALAPVAQPGAAGVRIIQKKQQQQREHGLPLKHPHSLSVMEPDTSVTWPRLPKGHSQESSWSEAVMLTWAGACPAHSSTGQVSVEHVLRKDRSCARSCGTAESLLNTCWRPGALRDQSFHFLLKALAVCLGETDGPVVKVPFPLMLTAPARLLGLLHAGCFLYLKERSSRGSSALALLPAASLLHRHPPSQERFPRGILRSPHGLLGHLADLGQRPQFLNRDICPERGWVPASVRLPLMDHVWTCGDVGQSNGPTFQNGGPSQPNCSPQGLSALHTCELPSWTLANRGRV